MSAIYTSKRLTYLNAFRAFGATMTVLSLAACSGGGGGGQPPVNPNAARLAARPGLGGNTLGGNTLGGRNTLGGDDLDDDRTDQRGRPQRRGSQDGVVRDGRPVPPPPPGGYEYNGTEGGLRPGAVGQPELAPGQEAGPEGLALRVRVQAAAYNPPLMTDATLQNLFDRNGAGRQIGEYLEPSARGQLFFSTGALDHAYATLENAVQQFQGPERFEASRSFARMIGVTKLVVDPTTRQTELVISFTNTVTSVLRGSLNGRSIQLAETSQNSNAIGPVQAYAQCLDAGPYCSVAFVRLTNAANQTAYFITRSSAVAYRIASAERIEENLEYNRFTELFRRSGRNGEFDHALSAKLHVTEVIGGVSSYLVALRAGVSESQFAPGSVQAVGLGGPLVKTEASAESNGPVLPMAWIAARGSAADTGSQLQDSIRRARLIRNNGRGAIMLELQLGDSLARIAFAARQPALEANVAL